MTERRHEERRANCQHCPLTHEGYCSSHAVFSTFWKWGLSVGTSLLVAGIGLVYTEARSIHRTLSEMKLEAARAIGQIRVEQAEVSRQVEVNTNRINRLETRDWPRNSYKDAGP